MSAPARLGRYRVDRRIGSGSFATVWLAHDEVLDAPVAIKVLADNWAHRLGVRERFAEEARILRRADSDRIVRVHDIGELEDGRPYFVMTYADRGALADRLADGPPPLPVALRYAADVARGLAVLHEVGVIHRDVTPANVLLRSGRAGGGDRVLIADLGLAKAAAHGSAFTLTVGTPGYMAPEQASGSGITKRTDVYAVGALLWHLLTGAAPAPDPPLPPGNLPPAVNAVLRQALARRPEDRFPSAAALADTLDAAAVELVRTPGGRGATGTPAAPPRPSRRRDEPDPDSDDTEVIRPGPARLAAATPADPDPTRVLVRPDPDRVRRPPTGPRRTGSAIGSTASHTAEGGGPPVGDDRDTRGSARSRRWRRRVALVVAALVLLASGAVAYLLAQRDRGTVEVTAASGLRVRLPASWARQQQASAWSLTPFGAAGKRGTALLVARDSAGWHDPGSATPGVFIGLAPGVTAGRLWSASAAPTCPHSKETRTLPSGLTGIVHRYHCPDATARLTEAVLSRPGSADHVFVQVKEPLAGDDAVTVLNSASVPVS